MLIKLNVTILSAMLIGAFFSITALNYNTYAVTSINGAGSTFVFPLMDTWRVEYQKVNPDVNINYQSIGSGAGVQQFLEKTIDFGATDAPLNNHEQSQAANPIHIPITIGSVGVTYNIPEVPEKGLKLTGPVVADIFLGKIAKWNDPKIQELNSDISLPDEDIIVVHRSDGSGTTFVFTEYLSAISEEWNSTIGKGKSIEWPVGLGAPGNEGVASNVLGSPYTIGYVELAYALTTGMPFASIQNKDGNFVEPSIETTQSAASSISTQLPKGDQPWSHITMVNAAGENAYPIASFVYVLLYKELSQNPSIDQAKAKGLVDFLRWAITEGQQFSSNLGYVSLPENIETQNQQTINSLTFNGNPIA